MTKKIRQCFEPGCAYPARPGLRRCGWHWLLKQPTMVQAQWAAQRRSRAPQPHRPRVPQAQWLAGHRWCSGCQTMVPLFYTRGSRCVACSSTAAHAAAIEKTYGLTAAEYDALFELQGGRCAICRQLSRGTRFAVDHDHATGVVRGLCCRRCNHDLLGAAHDDIEILRNAVRYLQTPPASGLWRPPATEAALVRDDGPPPY